MIPFFNPDIHDNHPNLDEAVRTYSVGPGRFCETLKPILRQASGGLHPVLTVSGTVALELCLRALGLTGKRIMLPAYGVVATMNAVANVGEPVFVDVETATGCLSVAKLDEAWKADGCRAGAVVHVWQGGHRTDRDNTCAWAKERGLMFVDDAACAVGADLQGADAGIYSFSGPKMLSCGQGGAALFADLRSYRLASDLVDHGFGWRKTGLSYTIGSNLRLSDLQAAFLLDEWDRAPERQERQKDCALVFNVNDHCLGAFHNVWFANEPIHRDFMIDRLKHRGIDARVQYAPYWMHPKWADPRDPYKGSTRAHYWRDRALHLPFGPGLTPDMAREIVAAL